jgi:hypothetical protein
MHGQVNQSEFLADISTFLGCYYLILAAMNLAAGLYVGLRTRTSVPRPYAMPRLASPLWLALGCVFAGMAVLAFSGQPSWMTYVSLPGEWRQAMDRMLGLVTFSIGSVLLLLALFVGRRFVVRPVIAWIMLNAALLFMGLSLTDPDFKAIVAKPDNVPIVGMIFLLGFFTWVATLRAVRNDERLARGEPPLEVDDSDRVLVWPDLVYIELICMVALSALLLVWAVALPAPLEPPASSDITPNPSKAPWYFVGLQEMLVYYDPWMAGVVLPSLVLFGLMAIPYLDVNEQGNGYYTIDQRKFAYLTFQFGFLVLWIMLILIGTFLRGPNWSFYGFYETWDRHKVEPLTNIDLSEYFWTGLFGVARPEARDNAGTAARLSYIIWREMPGIFLVLLYFIALPPAMVFCSRSFRSLLRKMGFMRYMVMVNLLLLMALLPIKMICRWAFNLKYFVSIPEYYLNL